MTEHSTAVLPDTMTSTVDRSVVHKYDRETPCELGQPTNVVVLPLPSLPPNLPGNIITKMPEGLVALLEVPKV
jgi:hypothetical protein